MEAIFVQWASINRHFVKRMCPLLLFRMMSANFFYSRHLFGECDWLHLLYRTNKPHLAMRWLRFQVEMICICDVFRNGECSECKVLQICYNKMVSTIFIRQLWPFVSSCNRLIITHVRWKAALSGKKSEF